MAYEPVVEELIQLIQENGWKKAFEEAGRDAHGPAFPRWTTRIPYGSDAGQEGTADRAVNLLRRRYTQGTSAR